MRGILVALEGIDGAGKTLVASLVAGRLRGRGLSVLVTREPWSPEYRALIRSLPDDDYSPVIEALLFAADRLVHVERIIVPGLASHDVVITDRYYYSSAAYQGARGVPVPWILGINAFAPEPDLAVYLDVPPDEGLRRRARAGRQDLSRFEKLDILRRAREIYLAMVEAGLLTIVDATGPPGRVAARVEELVLAALERRQ